MSSTFWRPLASLVFIAVFSIQTAQGTDLPSQNVQNALPELDKYVESVLKTTSVPGIAIAVVHQDRVVYLKGFGVREAGKDEQVDADTVFQLASVSKPLASTVLAALVGEGTISWDDRVTDHDPGFAMYDAWVTREVTLRDFLCHRSGLADHAGDLLEDLGFERAEVLRRLRFAKPTSSFRSQYAYTNFGYSEAAFAGVKPTGKAWEDVAADKLFRPSGMKSSSFRYADYSAAKNRALLHIRDKGKWTAKHVRMPDAQSPAGGASSTARDMAQWLRLQLGAGKFEGKQLIAAHALAETHRPQIIDHPPANPATDRPGMYGLGWNVSLRDDARISLGHSGGFELGAATVVTLLPGESLGIVVLTNASPIGVPEAISASFVDLVLKGKVEKDWLTLYQPVFAEIFKPSYGTAVDYSKPPANMSPPLPLDAYLGTYRNEYYGDLEIAMKDKSLVLRIGPKNTQHELRHWDRDIFTYQPAGENAAGLSGVTFWVGPDRKEMRVILENLDQQGQGSFARLSTKK